MPLFKKWKSPVEEFLHIYTRVHQLCTWSHGKLPTAFRMGVQEELAQQALVDWVRDNTPTIDYLGSVRQRVITNKASKSEIKQATGRAQAVLDDLDDRLAGLGRQL